MRGVPLQAALAALASALLFMAAAAGGGGPLLAWFVQLPLFYVGFAHGLNAAGLAAGGAVLVAGLLGGGTAGLGFAVAEALPCVFVVRQALLFRRYGERPEDIEWYPAGKLLADLTFLVMGLTALGLGALAFQAGGLGGWFEAALERAAANLPLGGDPDAVVAWLVDSSALLPGLVAVSGLLMTVFNGMLGFWLAARANLARRPGARFAELTLPPACAWVLAAAALAALVASGNLAFFAQSAVLIAAVPFLFQGLAVVHALTARMPQPTLLLWLFYLSLVLLSWPLLLALIGLGLMEDRVKIRRRLS